MRKLTSMVSDGEGEDANPSHNLELFWRILVPKTRIGIITAEGGNGTWDEEWEIVYVWAIVDELGFPVMFQVEACIRKSIHERHFIFGLESIGKLYFSFIRKNNAWYVTSFPKVVTAIRLIPAEEEGEGLRIWLEEEAE